MTLLEFFENNYELLNNSWDSGDFKFEDFRKSVTSNSIIWYLYNDLYKDKFEENQIIMIDGLSFVIKIQNNRLIKELI